MIAVLLQLLLLQYYYCGIIIAVFIAVLIARLQDSKKPLCDPLSSIRTSTFMTSMQ